MEDVQMVAVVVALVALVRAQWPAIDGKAFVFAIAVVLGEAVVWLVGGSLAAWRATTIHGLVIALTAAGGMQALSYAAGKIGGDKPPPTLPSARGFASIRALAAASIVGIAVVLVGCLGGAGKIVCPVIHVADQVCPMVLVDLPDGGREMVPASAVRRMAEQQRAERLGDGGAP
jgi:hypothetical protein